MLDIAKIIENRRLELDMTYRQIEAISGISDTEIYHIEKKGTEPRFYTAEAILSAMGLRLAVLPSEGAKNEA